MTDPIPPPRPRGRSKTFTVALRPEDYARLKRQADRRKEPAATLAYGLIVEGVKAMEGKR